MKPGSHRYVAHDNLLLAVDGDLALQARALTSRRSPFALREPTARRWLRRLPITLLLPTRVLRVIFTVLMARISGRDCLQLPYKADIAIRCRPCGYKYFDFGTRWVVVDTGSVFSGGDFEHYLRRLKAVGDAGLGPRVRALKSGNNLYQEELVEGKRVRSILDEWYAVESPLAEFLQRIARLPGCRRMRLTEYRAELARQWRDIQVGRSQMAALSECMGDVIECWNRHIQVAEQSSDRDIPLTLSHGDFREKNFSMVDGRIVAFDWLSVDERSRHYDLHSILFTALVHLPVINDDLRHLVYQRLARLRSWSLDDATTAGIAEDGAQATAHDVEYSIFVLEFLITRLRHFVMPYGAQSAFGAKMLAQLGRYIDEFERYRQSEPVSPGAATHRSGDIPCVV